MFELDGVEDKTEVDSGHADGYFDDTLDEVLLVSCFL